MSESGWKIIYWIKDNLFIATVLRERICPISMTEYASEEMNIRLNIRNNAVGTVVHVTY